MGTIAAGGTRSEREGMISCLVTDARALSLRAAVREILRLYKENDILTYASAISFQVFFALVPMALLALGLSSQEAREAIGSISPNGDRSVEELLRLALRGVGR